ncbi:bifunctional 2-polyprenyl-6-hydroxyphenol methylase/3-demethylubiquinol 3-O-methyltransferase UbiG [Leptotrichia sp. OH3620_COT-345]|uniref:class I SAM-dependent methyltransferase n=1 Tax=Leptotrichia sp. OH3620_COT-345 TaxID=2491048 RepID=UPI0018F5684F|nr:methyltransferase domain-containing protein [Leptotrichia sp. OH3620_COT-345]
MPKETENEIKMKKFYNTISEKYDFIFPLSSLQKKFMDEEVKGEFILDVGAATGNLSEYLIEKKYKVLSIDINEKLINKAVEKGIPVIGVNMLEIDMLHKFDTIINIGNTLPHLKNKDEIRDFLKKAFDSLTNKGKIIIQLVNFNKFLLQKDENNFLGILPLIENKNVKFERFYYLNKENNIIFKTVLDNTVKNEEILVNINYNELKKYFDKTGFKNVKVYGGFDKSEFSFEKSLYLVMTAEK